MDLSNEMGWDGMGTKRGIFGYFSIAKGVGFLCDLI